MTRNRWFSRIEDAIYDSQMAYIRAKFGDEAERNANYGWGVVCSGNHIDVATKVYGHGVLRSIAAYPSTNVSYSLLRR